MIEEANVRIGSWEKQNFWQF